MLCVGFEVYNFLQAPEKKRSHRFCVHCVLFSYDTRTTLEFGTCSMLKVSLIHQRIHLLYFCLGKVCIRAKWPIRPELIPAFVAWSDWEYFYSPLDGLLVHRRVALRIKFPGTHLYTWVERGNVRVKCLAQEHNTVSPARAWTQATWSGVEPTNHEVTTPPKKTLLECLAENSLRLIEISRGVGSL